MGEPLARAPGSARMAVGMTNGAQDGGTTGTTRVYLTGGLRVVGPGGSLDGAELPGPQARVALVALVLERAPMSFDRLADLLWDGAPPTKWKGALAAVVSKVRAGLASTGLDGSRVLASNAGAYAVHLPGDAWVDVEDAIRRVDRAEAAVRRGDPERALPDAVVASAILRRPLLSGLWSEWIVDQRARLEAIHHRCLAVLAQGALDRGDPGMAAVQAQAMVDLDPLREVGHRLLAAAEVARGDRAAAVRALDRCRTVLADELGVRPSPETLALSDSLRS